MTSCLTGPDSGDSQGSGLASANDSTIGSHTASPVSGLGSNPSFVSPFSAANLASPPTSTQQQNGVNNNNNNSNSAVSPPISSSSASGVAAAAASPTASTGGNGSGLDTSSVNLSECDPARFAAGLSGYPRLAAGSLGSMYSAAAAAATYPSNEQNPYPSIAMDNSFYGLPYAMKDGAATGAAADMNAAWSSATALQPTGYYAGYDHPSLAAYGYGTGYDLASRRKNATRESTATLKAWLNEHKKNPYPTKGEKIMLAIITKMTLTQVSTWFANARRRLKKENKMTWEPKNKLDDEDVEVSDDDDKDRDDKDDDPKLGMHPHHMSLHGDSGSTDGKSSAGIPIPPSKPKIWSLADTAVCKTPPPSQHGGVHQQHQGGLQGQQGQQLSQHQGYQDSLHGALYGGGGGMGGANNPAASAGSTSAWGPASFNQFVDPMMRLRHPNMLGMGYMAGLPQQHAFSGQHAAAAAAAAAAAHAAAASQLPSGSPGGESGSGLQSSDTPPHTPPTANNSLKSGLGGLSNGGQLGYNGGGGGGGAGSLSNGYSQMSPSSGPESAASKVLMFNSPINNSFKMI